MNITLKPEIPVVSESLEGWYYDCTGDLLYVPEQFTLNSGSELGIILSKRNNVPEVVDGLGCDFPNEWSKIPKGTIINLTLEVS